jgi:hypothetical protein
MSDFEVMQNRTTTIMPPIIFRTLRGERVVLLLVSTALLVWILALFTVGRYVPDDSAISTRVTRSLIDQNPSYTSEADIDQPANGWENVTDLIMVAGHTIFTGSDFGETPVNESHWYLPQPSNTRLIFHPFALAVIPWHRYLQAAQTNQLDSFIQHIKVRAPFTTRRLPAPHQTSPRVAAAAGVAAAAAAAGVAAAAAGGRPAARRLRPGGPHLQRRRDAAWSRAPLRGGIVLALRPLPGPAVRPTLPPPAAPLQPAVSIKPPFPWPSPSSPAPPRLLVRGSRPRPRHGLQAARARAPRPAPHPRPAHTPPGPRGGGRGRSGRPGRRFRRGVSGGGGGWGWGWGVGI